MMEGKATTVLVLLLSMNCVLLALNVRWAITDASILSAGVSGLNLAAIIMIGIELATTSRQVKAQ